MPRANRREPVDGVTVRMATPFNVRPLERAHELGNSFGLVFVALPVGEATAEETKELDDEGIEYASIPRFPRKNN